MPVLKPFAGVRYDTAMVSLDRVLAPPYDVIDDRLRGELYGRDPRNIVRLILSREADPYAAAARDLAAWRRDGVLRPDPAPAIYLLEQEWEGAGGGRHRRTGFIAACLLEEFGGSVLPHERTHSGPKEDRLRLAQATGMMFSQIFSLYADPAGELEAVLAGVRTTRPDAEALHDGVRNRLWVSTDGTAALAAAGFLRNRNVLIADGHHRYETALAYRNAMRLQDPAHRGSEAYNFVPMFFSNLNDPGLLVLPTHRILHSLPGFDPEDFLVRLRDYFTLTPAASAREAAVPPGRGRGGALGLALPDGRAFLLEPTPRADALLESFPPVVAGLDVMLLHEVVIGRILGISRETQERKLHLEYERDTESVLRAVGGGGGRRQAAFLMQAPPVEQVKLAAEAGHVMPQKTTFFHPKLPSGLVCYPFTGPDAP